MQITTAHLSSRTEPLELRRVYGCFPTGVAAVCALGEDGTANGMAVSSFTTVSLDPPLVSVSMQSTSTTWPVLRQAPTLGVSVLAHGQKAAAAALAARGIDRFANVPHLTTPSGAVLIDGATAWMECAVEAEHVAGDHTIVLLRVHTSAGDPARAPLVFHGSRFHGLQEL
ncbi:putative flavin reductase [Actinoplanes missouriensis 431]|uniref:Putative flavin reductase n=1 Tax=Actinoplanes missouriensis (strain ATCC 14538 / DSM 43046 / CBS 188.64 / JCM 3121 / NBRC 102363 / NCIMB 12654 / NRRL B-3342 / UNCC 431) TaxID=512565 RepID=I0H4L4_ACTM4|nr:flavin reductase family protein [Actinoplanes missouriensis]BAL87951.1 putative flavin reductase [Actinoplanes missouriensis 431]